MNLFTPWKGCNRCVGAKAAFSAVHIVNIVASKCSVSRGSSISSENTSKATATI